MFQKAKADLLVIQSYEVIDCSFCEEEQTKKKKKEREAREGRKNKEPFDLASSCILTYYTRNSEADETNKPPCYKVNQGTLPLQLIRFGPDEMSVLFGHEFENQIKYKCLVTKRGEKKE